jgi:hypothetical protein
MCMGEKYRVCPVTEPDGGTTDCEIHLGGCRRVRREPSRRHGRDRRLISLLVGFLHLHGDREVIGEATQVHWLAHPSKGNGPGIVAPLVHHPGEPIWTVFGRARIGTASVAMFLFTRK